MLVIFDLDGVLCDLKGLHYECLNSALEFYGYHPISEEDHLCKYDGLPTLTKLQLLKCHPDHIGVISALKQEGTLTLLESYVKPNINLVNLFVKITQMGWTIGVCSNAKSQTVFRCLELLGIDFVISYINTPDDNLPKPSPQMMLYMIACHNGCPKNTVIFEDSPNGLKAAWASGAKVVQVNKVITSEEDVLPHLTLDNGYQYQWPELNVVIPAAGEGKRFKDAGYVDPKPFIKLPNGKRMITNVVDNLNVGGCQLHQILRRDHLNDWGNCTDLRLAHSVFIDKLTRGTAETCLLISSEIDNNKPLIIANSDQLLEWDPVSFYYFCQNTNLDGVVTVFNCLDRNPKWSYCKLDDNRTVTELVEKEAVSDLACCGVWFWKRGSDFCKYAREMIASGITVKGEFYISTVYNYAIADHKRVGTFVVDKMTGLGTPEDLEKYKEQLV